MMAKYVAVSLAIGILSGCNATPDEPVIVPLLPVVQSIHVLNNPESVLSAIVMLGVRNGTTAAVEVFRDSVLDHITPTVPIMMDSVVLPVVGLRPESRYAFRVKVISSTGYVTTSAPIEYSTQSLPSDLPVFTVVYANFPTVRFVMLGITSSQPGKSYAVIIDTGGHPVWYKAFSQAVVDFQKQPNGRYTAWSSNDGSAAYFHEFDVLGTVTHTYRALNGLDTGPHELRMQGSTYALFGLDYRTIDMTSYGGLPNASVKGIVVEYHRAGEEPFLWNTFDHFALTDGASDASLTGPNVNPWHGNAIDIDVDGNLLVSFRNADVITKINSHTGEILWRMGGKHNEFTFVNDDVNGFSHQHGVRRLPNGNIILFDNGNLHTQQVSRAVEYRVDEIHKTAERVWEYRPDPPLYGFALGFAQRLPNENTLICFGIAQHIIEVDQTGNKCWEITINDSDRYAYRAFAIESLY